MRLKRHIVDATVKAEEEERLRKLFGSKDKWAEVVEVFFKYVENVYLAELIVAGLVTTTRVSNGKNKFDTYELPAFFIAFANTTIRLKPIFQPTLSSLGVIEVRSSANTERERFFVCDLTLGWLAPARETGLRGMLRNYLPENLVALNEDLFHDVLFDTVSPTEHLITYDKHKVLHRLSFVLDDILDPSRKDSVSRFIGVIKSLPVVERAKSLSGKVKSASLPRMSGPGVDAQRLLPQYREGKVEGQAGES